jgi:hypothetical protein
MSGNKFSQCDELLLHIFANWQTENRKKEAAFRGIRKSGYRNISIDLRAEFINLARG